MKIKDLKNFIDLRALAVVIAVGIIFAIVTSDVTDSKVESKNVFEETDIDDFADIEEYESVVDEVENTSTPNYVIPNSKIEKILPYVATSKFTYPNTYAPITFEVYCYLEPSDYTVRVMDSGKSVTHLISQISVTEEGTKSVSFILTPTSYDKLKIVLVDEKSETILDEEEYTISGNLNR